MLRGNSTLMCWLCICGDVVRIPTGSDEFPAKNDYGSLSSVDRGCQSQSAKVPKKSKSRQGSTKNTTVTSMFLTCLMDGLNENFNIQAVVEIKSGRKIQRKRRKNSYSKVFECVLSCLNSGKHSHMLKFCNKEKTRFKVILKNKKNRRIWNESDISLFKEVDSLFENKKRSALKYEEDAKGRFRANMNKLAKSNYIKYIRSEKEIKSVTEITYEIILPKYIAEVNSKYQKENEVINGDSIANIVSSNGLADGSANPNAFMDTSENYSLRSGENQIPPNCQLSDGQNLININICGNAASVLNAWGASIVTSNGLVDGFANQDVRTIVERDVNLLKVEKFCSSLTSQNLGFSNDLEKSHVNVTKNGDSNCLSTSYVNFITDIGVLNYQSENPEIVVQSENPEIVVQSENPEIVVQSENPEIVVQSDTGNIGNLTDPSAMFDVLDDLNSFFPLEYKEDSESQQSPQSPLEEELENYGYNIFNYLDDEKKMEEKDVPNCFQKFLT